MGKEEEPRMKHGVKTKSDHDYEQDQDQDRTGVFLFVLIVLLLLILIVLRVTQKNLCDAGVSDGGAAGVELRVA